MNQNMTLLLTTIAFLFGCIAAEDNDTLPPANPSMTYEQITQFKLLETAQQNCLKKLNQTEMIKDKSCPAIWDGALCWPETLSNTVAQQKCPNYVAGFNHNGIAYKRCTDEGTWFFNQETNSIWTDFTDCAPKKVSDDFNLELIPHIGNFKIISKIGYSVSFGTLLIAFFILTFCKLFASFMIRSFMFLIKHIFVSTQASRSSLSPISQTDQHSSLSFTVDEPLFADENPTLSCKIFTTVWQYSLVANYNWILMEGLYLHNLIFLHIFNDNSSIRKYIILGWVVNYARQYRYRTWFKSTLVLVPLFGVHYMILLVFSSLSAISVSFPYDIFEIIWLYIDLLFSSFQGCVVALLYCFCNGEVQQEVRKLWQAWRSNHSSTSLHSHHSNHSQTHQSYLTQSLTYLSRGRNSLLSPADNNVINRKEVLSNRSRSPSPSKNQFQATNTLIPKINGQKIPLEPNNSSSFGLISDKQNNLNVNTTQLNVNQINSSNESEM